ncbi:MAG TPA: hypothetical protein VFC74_08545 [Oscillospiraceae bacterium]|nr:hypothetical protein [Oscillospiraceae bacterium]
MQIMMQRNSFHFFGTIRELRFFLRTLPRDLTLREFIALQIN